MRRQRGVTTIGWIFLLIPVALVLYAGIRVGPEYMDYYKVVQALKETATEAQERRHPVAAEHPCCAREALRHRLCESILPTKSRSPRETPAGK